MAEVRNTYTIFVGKTESEETMLQAKARTAVQ
jgi:hypothetical protein